MNTTAPLRLVFLGILTLTGVTASAVEKTKASKSDTQTSTTAESRPGLDLQQETLPPYRCPSWLRTDTTGIWAKYGAAQVTTDNPAWNNADSRQPALRKTVKMSSLAELKAWAAHPTPSTRVILEDGNYASDESFSMSGIIGTREEPVVITARNPLKAVFLLGGFTLADSRWVTVEGIAFRGLFTAKAKDSYVTLLHNESCRLTGCVIEPEDNGNGTGALRPGQRYDFLQIGEGVANRVDHCRVRGKKSMGPMIRILPTERVPLLEYNQFMDFTKGNGNGFEGLQLGNDASYSMGATVRYNWFERLNGENEVISVKTTDQTIFANTFLDNGGELCVRAANNVQIINNLFINSMGDKNVHGIRNQGDDTLILGNDFLGTSLGIETQCGDKAVDFPPGVAHMEFGNVKKGDFTKTGNLERFYRQSRRVQVLGNRFISVRKPFNFKGPEARPSDKGNDEMIQKDLPPTQWRIVGNLIQTPGPVVLGSGETEMTWLNNLAAGPADASALGRKFTPEAMSLELRPLFIQDTDGSWKDASGQPLTHPGIRKAETGPEALVNHHQQRN